MNLNHEINKIILKLNKKEFKNVINSCEKLIKLKIENTIIYNLFGRAYQNLALYEKSIIKFEKAIALNKDNYYAINNLAISLKALEKYKLSEKAYQKCLKINPNYIDAILNYANLKEFLNDFEVAIDLYLSALKLKSETTEAYIYSKLSRLYLSIGKTKKAKEYSLQLIKKYRYNTNFYQLYSEMADFKKDQKFISDMEKLYENKDLSKDDLINLAFSLGRAHDKLNNFGKAFTYFNKGNKLKRTQINFNLEDLVKLTSSIKSFFSNINYDEIKKQSNPTKIIFICGMPRSGTTLIEQIISSHNQVIPMGENNYLSNFIKKNYLNGFNLDQRKITKDIYSKGNLVEEYTFNLLNEFGYKSNFFTDKSVQNFFWIGFIKIFIPNSKIIITDRNSRDICLSIFKLNFKNGFMNFAYDQKDIGNFYNVYSDLISFWKKILKEDIYVCKYENLIDNSQFEIKKMIDFCDLDWDPNCLNHHTNQSGIKTASVNQARRPIYNTSKNLNKNYSDNLAEMFGILKN